MIAPFKQAAQGVDQIEGLSVAACGQLLAAVSARGYAQAATKIPGAGLSMYDGVGHAPFWEDTARFNSELAAFVRAANKTN